MKEGYLSKRRAKRLIRMEEKLSEGERRRVEEDVEVEQAEKGGSTTEPRRNTRRPVNGSWFSWWT